MAGTVRLARAQVWVKDMRAPGGKSGKNGQDVRLALLLVNLGQTKLGSYEIPLATLPTWCVHSNGGNTSPEWVVALAFAGSTTLAPHVPLPPWQ